MNDFPTNVKEKLNSIIMDMAKHHWLFSNNPGHDFMRQDLGKLSFYDTMRMIIGMGKGNTNDEIMDYFDLDPDRIPSQSAFCQRRSQISLSAFEYLFSEFSSSFPRTTNKFKDHCILACDGCHVVYTTNSEIIEDYNKPRLIDYKGYNHMHLNGFVDVISKAFLDVVIQPGQQPDERKAFHTMLDHFRPDDPEKYIVTADRGYESYNNMAHITESGNRFLIRLRDSKTSGIISGLDLPDGEYDTSIVFKLVRKQSNEIKAMMRKDKFLKFVPSTSTFDFLPAKSKKTDPAVIYELPVRLVRFKITNETYEVIATNLPENEFSPAELKQLYAFRWGIETSFRDLKYTVGLLHFHAKKTESILQEIWARLIMYNFSELVASHTTIKKSNRKHLYRINFSNTVHICRNFLLRRIPPSDVEALVAANILPIRSGKSHPRVHSVKHAAYFIYRVA